MVMEMVSPNPCPVFNTPDADGYSFQWEGNWGEINGEPITPGSNILSKNPVMYYAGRLIEGHTGLLRRKRWIVELANIWDLSTPAPSRTVAKNQRTGESKYVIVRFYAWTELSPRIECDQAQEVLRTMLAERNEQLLRLTLQRDENLHINNPPAPSS